MATNKPKIVGLYGVPGSGKTYLKGELKFSLDENQYPFYDGSEILALVTDGSLDSFKAMTRTGEHIKEHMQREMTKLRELCVANGIFFTSVQEPRSASDEQSFSLQPDVARLLTDCVAVPREEIKYVNTSRALSILDEQLRAAYATATTLLYPCHCNRRQPARYQNVARSRSKSRTVVVGPPSLRSRSMEAVLTSDIAAEKLRRDFTRALLPNSSDKLQIPAFQVGTLAQLHLSTSQHWSIGVRNAGDKNAVKLLMSATRDTKVSGRALQAADCKIGRYLPDLIGLESFKMSHVQGGYTAGHRLQNEKQTTIIALMRGGEPMAFVVHDTLPSHKPNSYMPYNLDSVINSGKSIADHINHIRTFNLAARIVIIAGIVDRCAPYLYETNTLGRGGTDTGNRLFNITDLDR
ncbi:hypothetical protein CKM354_000669800 [Cercospora kikuchii]|uniref:Phosphoribosyltransferase domain-containing protein n=1 Tax=Cercospora kikuchii TaxID=84275 RepID=A0A9P3FDK3_9PEZI|nr:uncharacterized protein CKM354_000669800 [Cercospora kikuchii]GIZ43471.1 hypothetical protein CKM354_000669800 [Cercospora kikuchii]